MNQNKGLNVSRIKELMDQGFRALKAPKGSRQAVLVIGDTGVGKSTIISLLAGLKLVVKNNGLNIIIDSADAETKVKIGHQKYSETTVPTKIVIDDLDFFDCSGFRDNRGDEFEISNSFFLQRLFYLYDKVKILLIIDEHYITEARLDKLPKLIHSLGEAFGNIQSIQDGVVLLVNRAKINRNLNDYSKEIQKLAHLKGEKPLFSTEEKKFLEYLIENKRLILFKQADESQVGKPFNVSTAQIVNPIKNSQFIKNKKIKNIISESAKLAIRDYADELLAEGQQKFDDFVRKVKTQFLKQKGAVATVQETEQTLKSVEGFIEGLKKSNDLGICEYLKANIPNLNQGSIGKDISSILFLRQIYEKSNGYFTILKHKMISELTVYLSHIQEQLVYLKKRQEQIAELKNRQLELQRKLKAEEQERNKIKRQSEEFQTAIKNKDKYLDQFKGEKEKEIENLKIALSTEKKHVEKILSEKEQTFANYKEEQSKRITQLSSKAEEQSSLINQLKVSQKQNKNQIAKIEEQKNHTTEELETLRLKFQKLRVDFDHNLQEIDELNHENESLRIEIENMDNVSMAQSAKSMASKSSKYPDVVCPHFKNGGKCKHCIRKWKQAQKAMKEQI